MYVVCDEVLKALKIPDDPQARMTNAEVMTFCLVAAALFGGNHKRTRWFCKRSGYFSTLLSDSRLNRRSQNIPWKVWMAVFRFLAAIFTQGNKAREFAVDSFPVQCCQKSRIDRRAFFHGKQ